MRTYNVTQIANLLKVHRSRASIIIRDQGWPFTWQGRAKHFDAATVDAYIAQRPTKSEPSGYPQRMVATALTDDEYQLVLDNLTTRERGEAMLERIDKA